MAIKLDNQAVTQSISEIDTGFQGVTISKIDVDMSKSTIKIASLFPGSMDKLSSALESVKTLGTQMATNMESCKNTVLETENQITHEIANATLQVREEGN